MSAISRNAPCPCGSGRKYKRCCLPRDAERERKLSLVPPDLRALSGGRDAVSRDAGDADEPGARAPATGTWQVDLTPIPTTLDADPKARAALGLVVRVDDLVVLAEAIQPAPNELDEITDVIESLLERGAEVAGAWPSMVRVRHTQIRALLAPRLAARGITVRTARKLPALDRARRSFAKDVFGIDDTAALSTFVGTWSQWGAPAELVAEVFAASREYRNAQPWRALSDAEWFRVVVPGGGVWNVVVLGQAGEAFGIALHEQYNDILRMQNSESGAAGIAAIQGQTISLTFDARRDVPREFRDDVKRNRWGLPAPDVYPVLATVNTPGGGVTRRQLHDLVAILRAMAALSVGLRAVLADEKEPGIWTHSATGVHVLFDRDELAFAVTADETAVLTPSGPAGPGAEPLARLDLDQLDDETQREMDVVGRFDEWCRTTATVAEAGRDAANAEMFVNFLAQHHGVPLRAVTEYDLRVFLHDWVHRKVVMSNEDAAGVPASIGRFFEYLAEREGIVCPWAAPLIGDSASYRYRRASFPGGFWWDPGVEEWRAQLGSSLIARALVPETSDPDGVGGGATMGVTEAALEAELQRLWLLWRDELIRSGLTERHAVVEALLGRQASWERTPNAIAHGATPRTAVANERSRRRPL